MEDDVLKAYLEENGYYHLKEIPGRGLCGVRTFMYTIAIVYGLDKEGYVGRYCYPHENAKDLALAYLIWDGVDDPIGPWVKHKGEIEYSNPNN